MKYLKKINEEYEIFLNDEEIETNNKELYDAFDISKIDTTIQVDLEWYIEIGLNIAAKFCVDNNLTINKSIVNELVNRIKSYTEEYVLYQNTEYTDWVNEYDWVEVDLIELIEKQLPSEHEKYKKKSKSKNFNI